MDESEGAGAKGDPPLEPVPDPIVDRTTLVLGKEKGSHSDGKAAACGTGEAWCDQVLTP